MPQQINLCTPLLLAPKRYFSAQTMALALAVFLVLGGAMCGAWVWNLNHSTAGLQQLQASQATELAALKATAGARRSRGPRPAAVRNHQPEAGGHSS